MPHHPQGPCDRQPWGSCERPHLPSPSMGSPVPFPSPSQGVQVSSSQDPQQPLSLLPEHFLSNFLLPHYPGFGRHLPPTALSGPTGPPSLEGLHPTLENIKQNVTEVRFAHRSPRARLNVPSPGDSRMRRGGGAAWAWLSGPRGCLGPCLVTVSWAHTVSVSSRRGGSGAMKVVTGQGTWLGRAGRRPGFWLQGHHTWGHLCHHLQLRKVRGFL